MTVSGVPWVYLIYFGAAVHTKLLTVGEISIDYGVTITLLLDCVWPWEVSNIRLYDFMTSLSF